MKTARKNGSFGTVRDQDRDAAMETIGQLLERTEQLAADVDLTEVAFLIGVALASLRQESHAGIDFDAYHGTSSQIM
jgi:hypothetical protein